ncbi:4'-phosphopantetheinyl transferase superfamily protein [Mesomycoplasma molare]|uniref:4'-phosphopantetheinyl transferase superfamily protein n=1 Tax=Mesomycoplasma molare TaxID=171288 RepID=A0ABY5TUS8_9BACT|nr:4'-phosphopantetheinyl transferase superfamily protein [Mesomycoplasma molare]UWD34094.1 4'-phosphopantetheinyl transferase superfamily protein [Mesomycoplasma molare]
MIGVDLTQISRFKNKKETFVRKILSKNEILEYENSENKEKFLATRWAIKEAIFKADNSFFEFNLIDIKKENKRYKFREFEISTSYENNLVIAIVYKK